MTNDILQTSKLPHAIAQEKDGIKLYWVEELGITGIHQRGLASLLCCDGSLVRRTIASIEAAAEITLLEAEAVTDGGLQKTFLIIESDLEVILRQIIRSNANKKTIFKAQSLLLNLFGSNCLERTKRKETSVLERNQYVYIIQCHETKVIKIGVSNNALRRLSSIQTGYPYQLNLVRTIKTFSAHKLEKTLHKALDDFRLKGEWFDGLALQMIGE